MDYSKKVAEKYDKILYPALHRIRKKMVEIIKKYNVASVVDLCCGTGNQLKYLNDAGIQNAVGVDLSENMLNQANKYNVNCKLDDATATNFVKDNFDFGMISFALHEKSLQTAQNIIVEAQRIIKKDGYFAIVDYCFDKKSFFLGRWGSIIVEKMAGGEHYANFKAYIKAGGLNLLMKNFKAIEEYRFLFGAVVLRVYQL
jgi:demethylmenaquinone methyltransferase/2-methoxy-6-polyprenyl-1,4-benzoquinol methylase